jgi:hypothetical protein
MQRLASSTTPPSTNQRAGSTSPTPPTMPSTSSTSRRGSASARSETCLRHGAPPSARDHSHGIGRAHAVLRRSAAPRLRIPTGESSGRGLRGSGVRVRRHARHPSARPRFHCIAAAERRDIAALLARVDRRVRLLLIRRGRGRLVRVDAASSDRRSWNPVTLVTPAPRYPRLSLTHAQRATVGERTRGIAVGVRLAPNAGRRPAR